MYVEAPNLMDEICLFLQVFIIRMYDVEYSPPIEYIKSKSN